MRPQPRPEPAKPPGAAVWDAVVLLRLFRLETMVVHLVSQGYPGATGREVGEQLWALQDAGYVIRRGEWYAPVNGAPSRLVLDEGTQAAIERIASSLEVLAHDAETPGMLAAAATHLSRLDAQIVGLKADVTELRSVVLRHIDKGRHVGGPRVRAQGGGK